MKNIDCGLIDDLISSYVNAIDWNWVSGGHFVIESKSDLLRNLHNVLVSAVLALCWRCVGGAFAQWIGNELLFAAAGDVVDVVVVERGR